MRMEIKSTRRPGAAEQLMLRWHEKVEKQPAAQLRLKKEVGEKRNKRKEKKGGNYCFRKR